MVLAALKSLSEMELPADNVPVWMEGVSAGREQTDIDRIERAAYFAIKAQETEFELKSGPTVVLISGGNIDPKVLSETAKH